MQRVLDPGPFVQVEAMGGEGQAAHERGIAEGQAQPAPGAQRRGQPQLSPQRLQRWARERRSDNTIAAYSFDGINRLFSNDELHLTLARGRVLGCTGKLSPLLQLFWKRAAGV